MNKVLIAVFSIVGAFFLLGASSETKSPGEGVVLFASATSASKGSAPVTCLLEADCQGYWSPESKDTGVDEGIYLRFLEPTHFNYIEIITEEPMPESMRFEVYLDGQTAFELPRDHEAALSALDITAPLEDENSKFVKSVEVHTYDDRRHLVSAAIGIQYTAGDGWYDIYDTASNLPLDYRAQSVFIRLRPYTLFADDPGNQPPKITSIRFSGTNSADTVVKSASLALKLPRTLPGKVTATGALTPEFAYGPERLFDSQIDMAWGTDGKKSDGIGENVRVQFEKPQEIHGLMLWSGYQRSAEHFLANARVKALTVGERKLRLLDKQGPQILPFGKPITTQDITLTIADIYPGGSYPDVLISELRFLGPDNTIILPQAALPSPALPPALSEFAGRTLRPIVHESVSFYEDSMECLEECVTYHSTMRLRTNGSFVMYSGEIIEGNWEAMPDGKLRLFGKRYRPSIGVSVSGYLRDEETEEEEEAAPPPRIFQTLATIKRFADLSEAERENAVHFMLRTKWNTYGDTEASPFESLTGGPWSMMIEKGGGGHDYIGYIGGETMDEAVKNIVAALMEINPFYMESDVYSEILR